MLFDVWIPMPRPDFRALPTLLATVLLSAACSNHSSKPAMAPSSPAVSRETNTPVASGKTLTEDQLAKAGLTGSELPSGLELVSEYWKPIPPASVQATGDAVCQPVIDLLFATGKASAGEANSYQGPDIIYPVGMRLASYSPAEVLSSFSAVRDALQRCTSISWTSYGATKHGALTPVSAPKLGDDSVGFTLTYTAEGQPPLVEIHDFFRVGTCTFFASAMDNVTMPPRFPQEVLNAQINKLKAMQSS